MDLGEVPPSRRATVPYVKYQDRAKREEAIIDGFTRTVLRRMSAPQENSEAHARAFAQEILLQFPAKINSVIKVLSDKELYGWHIFNKDISVDITHDEEGKAELMEFKPVPGGFRVSNIFFQGGIESHRNIAQVKIDYDQELGFIEEIRQKTKGGEFSFNTRSTVDSDTTPDTLFTITLNPLDKDMSFAAN